VTSHEAGMSVPDWPTSYGYNMFALPIKFWKGGAFYEHTHRLLGTVVGTLATVLALWLWIKDQRKWMRWLGTAAFLLVVLQGILGGLRVDLKMASLGIFHGAIAQACLVLMSAISLFSSRWWINSDKVKQIAVPKGLRSHILWVTVLIFVQLIIAATMRHQHAGLAIPDFPLAYGKIWPNTSAEAIASYNERRFEMNGENPITAFQVVLQMVHRLVAYFIFLGVAAAAMLARKKLGGRDPLTKFAFVWLGLLTLQIVLGAATIWTNKAADIATLHVMVGALALLAGSLWCIVAARRTQLAH
jgi:cytochrome c oxidase assembly protein subunit 15